MEVRTGSWKHTRQVRIGWGSPVRMRFWSNQADQSKKQQKRKDSLFPGSLLHHVSMHVQRTNIHARILKCIVLHEILMIICQWSQHGTGRCYERMGRRNQTSLKIILFFFFLDSAPFEHTPNEKCIAVCIYTLSYNQFKCLILCFAPYIYTQDK